MIGYKAMHPSNELYLLAVDTVGIQKYIFSSNRLRENIGASHLVASVTGQWAFDAVREATDKHNVRNDGCVVDDSVTIDQPATAAEVLYSGGGNFVVLFRGEGAVKDFTRTLSRKALIEAPGLRLMIHSIPFVLGKDVLREKLNQLFKEIKERRSTLPSVMPLAGLGATVMCRSTGLPAVGIAPETKDDPDPRPASSEVLAKLAAVGNANDRLNNALSPGDGYEYPLDFDVLGRTCGKSSFIAVVHADGDGIGKIIEDIGNKYEHAAQLREHIKRLRGFSDMLAEASRNALKGTVSYLWQLAKASKEVAELFKKQYIPFRPLVFGGDDVTFVSDGRIGLALVLKYLEEFQAASGLTACAGVAIVKSHYPFARAYELAEDLCQSAKAYRRTSDATNCYLDWHFTTGGIYGDLKEIRQREYAVSAGSLTLRPVSAFGSDTRSWETIAAGLKAFQGEAWQEKRNKAKMLREKLRGGRPVVQEFETLYGQELPSINGFEHGWSADADGYSGYFDAIELMDLYLPLLQEEKVNEPDAAS